MNNPSFLDKLKTLAESISKEMPEPWHIGHQDENDENAAEIDAYDLTTLGCIYTNLSRAYILSFQPQTILTLLEIINIQCESLELYTGISAQKGSSVSQYSAAAEALERTDPLIKGME